MTKNNVNLPNNSGCGAVGSVLDWGSSGRKFKSCHSDTDYQAFTKFLCRGFFIVLVNVQTKH